MRFGAEEKKTAEQETDSNFWQSLKSGLQNVIPDFEYQGRGFTVTREGGAYTVKEGAQDQTNTIPVKATQANQQESGINKTLLYAGGAAVALLVGSQLL